MQEEVYIIFNSSIASTHRTNTLKIVSESKLIQGTKFKLKHSQFYNTTNVEYSEQGGFNRSYIGNQLTLELSQSSRISDSFIKQVPFMNSIYKVCIWGALRLAAASSLSLTLNIISKLNALWKARSIQKRLRGAEKWTNTLIRGTLLPWAPLNQPCSCADALPWQLNSSHTTLPFEPCHWLKLTDASHHYTYSSPMFSLNLLAKPIYQPQTPIPPLFHTPHQVKLPWTSHHHSYS